MFLFEKLAYFLGPHASAVCAVSGMSLLPPDPFCWLAVPHLRDPGRRHLKAEIRSFCSPKASGALTDGPRL